MHKTFLNGVLEINKLMVAKGERGRGRDKLGIWDEQIHTTINKIDKQ